MSGGGDDRRRRLLWRDRAFAEQWRWRGEDVLRWRAMSSYPWRYAIGQFTQAHAPYAERKDRPMTAEEIRDFKAAKATKGGRDER